MENPRRRKAKQAAAFSPPACHAGRSRQPGRPRFSRQVAIGQTESGRHRSRAHGRSAVDRNHSRGGGGASDPDSCLCSASAGCGCPGPTGWPRLVPSPPHSSRLQISLSPLSILRTVFYLLHCSPRRAAVASPPVTDPRRRSLVSRDCAGGGYWSTSAYSSWPINEVSRLSLARMPVFPLPINPTANFYLW